MTDPTDNILTIVNSLSSEDNKLDVEELARLFKYLTDKDNATLARVEKFLVSSPNSIIKLLYLRSLLKNDQPVVVKDLVEKISDLRTVLGDVYELSARSEVSKFQGSHYTSKFEIFDLFGLVRIALPRDLLSSENAPYDTQLCIASYRANKLSDYIHSKKMGERLESSIEFIRKLPNDSKYNNKLHDLANKGEIILKQWRTFERNPGNTTSRKKSYLANTRFLSVMLLTSYVLDPEIAIENGQAPFNKVLDIDFRGRVSGDDISNITIELGEIKSSNGSKAVKKAFRQLLLRLAVLSFVVEAMKKDDDDITKCKLVGKIYLPREPEFSIHSEWKSGIRFSNSAEYRIDIVRTGDKR